VILTIQKELLHLLIYQPPIARAYPTEELRLDVRIDKTASLELVWSCLVVHVEALDRFYTVQASDEEMAKGHVNVGIPLSGLRAHVSTPEIINEAWMVDPTGFDEDGDLGAVALELDLQRGEGIIHEDRYKILLTLNNEAQNPSPAGMNDDMRHGMRNNVMWNGDLLAYIYKLAKKLAKKDKNQVTIAQDVKPSKLYPACYMHEFKFGDSYALAMHEAP
jgi:hypothetical protein